MSTNFKDDVMNVENSQAQPLQIISCEPKGKDTSRNDAAKKFKDRAADVHGDKIENVIDDLDLIVSIIQRYGTPDKISLKCVIEYDSDNVKKNKKFVIKR